MIEVNEKQHIDNYKLKTFRGGVRDEKGRIQGNGNVLVETKDIPVKIKPYNPHIHQLHIHQYLDSAKSKFHILVCSRRFGKSMLALNQSIKWALSKPKQKVAYITASLRLCRKFFKEINEQFQGELRSIVIADSNKTELLITFANGSELQFFTFENPSKLRGFGFNYAIVDEAQDLEKESFFADVEPTFGNNIAKQVLILGTPNSTDSWFYDFYERGMSEKDEDVNYKSFHYTIWDIPEYLMGYTSKLDKQKNYPKDIFKMEWEAEFVDGLISVFKNYLECTINAESIPYDPSDTYFGGLDVGRSDYTVFTIMNRKFEMVYQLRVNQLDYYPMATMVINALKKYKVKRTVIEMNNAGTPFLEILKEKIKNENIQYHRFEEFVTLNDTKRDLIEDLIVAFQNKSIKILNLKPLLKELGKFVLSFSPKTKARIYKGIGNSHDDTVMSLAFAYKCVKDYAGSLNKEYIRIIKR